MNLQINKSMYTNMMNHILLFFIYMFRPLRDHHQGVL